MKIYVACFRASWDDSVIGYAMAEDGRVLASHLSSSADWAKHDMGLKSNWKHDLYAEYSGGNYELIWVDDPEHHEGWQEALKKNRERAGLQTVGE